MNPVFLPAIGALLVLAFDVFVRPTPASERAPRANALSGIRLGTVGAMALGGVLLSLPGAEAKEATPWLDVDAYAVLGIAFIAISGLLVLTLSLTHFGMARSRPAEPIALILFSLSGMAAAISTNHLLVLLVAFELAWLPFIALIAIDSRRLSSSESSLKVFFAHAFASIVFVHGVAFVLGATGRLDFGAFAAGAVERPLLFDVGVALVVVGVMARAAVAPFHPWSPDAHEGAPSFVTAHLTTAAQATTFFVLLRLLHAMLPGSGEAEGLTDSVADRLPMLLAALGCLGLVWGHAMALVQVGLRRMLGWIGVGQVGFFTLALIDARGEGGEALIFGLLASGVAAAGVLATLSSLSHHERACEQLGDLSGMMRRSPIRASLLALFLLSLGGFPGTIGFVARLRILAALEHSGHRGLLMAGLAATALALAAVGRPLLGMLRPLDDRRAPSRALTNEQLVLLLCGIIVVYLGLAPVVGGENLAGLLDDWIAYAVASLRS